MTLKELLTTYLIITIVVCICTGIIGGFAWTYSINHWLIYFHKDPVMCYWKGFLMGVIPPFGIISIGISLFTFILSMFIG